MIPAAGLNRRLEMCSLIFVTIIELELGRTGYFRSPGHWRTELFRYRKLNCLKESNLHQSDCSFTELDS